MKLGRFCTTCIVHLLLPSRRHTDNMTVHQSSKVLDPNQKVFDEPAGLVIGRQPPPRVRRIFKLMHCGMWGGGMMNGDGRHFGDLFLTLDAVQDGCKAAHRFYVRVRNSSWFAACKQ